MGGAFEGGEGAVCVGLRRGVMFGSLVGGIGHDDQCVCVGITVPLLNGSVNGYSFNQ